MYVRNDYVDYSINQHLATKLIVSKLNNVYDAARRDVKRDAAGAAS